MSDVQEVEAAPPGRSEKVLLFCIGLFLVRFRMVRLAASGAATGDLHMQLSTLAMLPESGLRDLACILAGEGRERVWDRAAGQGREGPTS